jgi:hypothetical protein
VNHNDERNSITGQAAEEGAHRLQTLRQGVLQFQQEGMRFLRFRPVGQAQQVELAQPSRTQDLVKPALFFLRLTKLFEPAGFNST